MNAFLTVIPLLLIRYGLLSILSKESLKRAAFFTPMIGKEKLAYSLYQISNILIFVYLCFLKITSNTYCLYTGLMIFGLGVLLCIRSTLDFAEPNEYGITDKGLYGLSRNPMYVAYFIYFLGCVLLTKSLVLLAILIVFQISAHWIILSEERWCISKFGDTYISYMQKVRRYF